MSKLMSKLIAAYYLFAKQINKTIWYETHHVFVKLN